MDFRAFIIKLNTMRMYQIHEMNFVLQIALVKLAQGGFFVL